MRVSGPYTIFLSAALLLACNVATAQNHRESSARIFGERDTVIADVDGDKRPDTLIESYRSGVDGKETYKTMDSEDEDNNVTLVMKNQPVCKLYALHRNFDSLLVSDQAQQKGIYFIERLGDLDGDGGDEIGYVINYADVSNLNTYHIAGYDRKKHKWVERASFGIHERFFMDEENLFDGKYILKRVGKGRIKVKYYRDDGEQKEKVIVLK